MADRMMMTRQAVRRLLYLSVDSTFGAGAGIGLGVLDFDLLGEGVMDRVVLGVFDLVGLGVMSGRLLGVLVG
jgi:hypothetical protein